MWLARDKNKDYICVFEHKPWREESWWVSDDSKFETMSIGMFPTITWENEPIEIEIQNKNPYNTIDTLPNSFGDYLVVIDEKGCGRRVAFRMFIPYSKNSIDVFGDKKQEGWILGENEKLIYWMKIPDWC